MRASCMLACSGGAEGKGDEDVDKARQEQQYYQDLLSNLARIKEQVSAPTNPLYPRLLLVLSGSMTHHKHQVDLSQF